LTKAVKIAAKSSFILRTRRGYTMKKVIVLSFVAAASLVALDASAEDILARVISSTPVVQQVAVPRQICNTQQVITEAPKSGGGALLGAVAGGAVGNAIGNGGGRALATMIGLVGGAIVGDRVEGSNSQLQNVQQCSTQTSYENRIGYYNVVYEYQGTQHNVQMAQDPGQYVRLQVTPVGAINQAPQPGFSSPQPDLQTQPQTSYQQVAVQPGYVVQQPVYLAPVVVQSYPSYYGRPYYPYSNPVGVSLNFGFGHGYGHGHWR
jgi:uncharacterized protein YcfJ